MTCVNSPSVSMFSLRLLVRTENGQLKRFDYACMYIRRCRCGGGTCLFCYCQVIVCSQAM